VPTAATMLSISKSLAYELVKQGRIPTIRLSGHLRVPVRALEQLIDELAAESLPTARH
jgi:excisionase family DNA binding protein